MHAAHAGRAGEAWTELGRRLTRPTAVLVASAHWETELPMLGTSKHPETIHDFGGFPPELYRIQYSAPGAPEIAQRALELLHGAGLPASANGCRGLDHGAWVPLLRLYPAADVPVAQISIQPSLDAAHHLRVGAAHHVRLGRALAPLSDENVLIIGSGHTTHNLRDFFGNMRRHEPLRYAEAFADWVGKTLSANDTDALVAYRDVAPQAERAHPTEEHMLPLHFAWGAAGEAPEVERVVEGFEAGALAMDSYLFRRAA